MASGGINYDPYHGISEVIFFAVTLSILAYCLPLVITILVLLPLSVKIYAKLSAGICQSYQRIDGKTVIITGANIGIGLETAKDLARRGGRIILACRNLEKGQKALDEVQRETGSQALVLKYLDLTSLASVRKFCKEIITEEPRLDILVNNAGLAVSAKSMTKDNMEVCMQTNHFAPFLLTHLLLDLLRKTGESRIVNVSSDAHRFAWTFDPENLNSEKSFNPIKVYGLSKLFNIYFTVELNNRLKSAGIKGISVNCLHPGAVRTAFLNHTDEFWYMRIINPMSTFFFKTAVEGAQTSIHLAISENLEGISGKYFADCKEATPTPLGRNADNARILWEKSINARLLKKAIDIKSEMRREFLRLPRIILNGFPYGHFKGSPPGQNNLATLPSAATGKLNRIPVKNFGQQGFGETQQNGTLYIASKSESHIQG